MRGPDRVVLIMTGSHKRITPLPCGLQPVMFPMEGPRVKQIAQEELDNSGGKHGIGLGEEQWK